MQETAKAFGDSMHTRLQGDPTQSGKDWTTVCTPKQCKLSLNASRREACPIASTRPTSQAAPNHTANVDCHNCAPTHHCVGTGMSEPRGSKATPIARSDMESIVNGPHETHKKMGEGYLNVVAEKKNSCWAGMIESGGHGLYGTMRLTVAEKPGDWW